MENLPVRIFWKDANLHYLGCNTLFVRDAGYASPAELIGKTDFEMPWKEQASLYCSDDRDVMREGPKLGYEEPQTTPEGKTIWLRTSKAPLRNDANELIGILGLYEDITEQRLLDAQAHQRDEIYRFMFENVEDIIFLLNKDGTFAAISPSMETLTGWKVEDWIGKSFIDLVFPGELAFAMEKFEETCAGKKTNTFELRLKLENGGQIISEQRLVQLTQNDELAAIGIARDVTERKRAEEEIHYFATIDSLTGLNNRRQFSTILDNEVERVKRYGTPFSLIMCDIDHFKLVNENFGHHVGDLVLRQLARLLQENTRTSDITSRWGGEEFMILLPHTALREAGEVAEKVRAKISAHNFDQAGNLTVSFGVTSFMPDENLDSMLIRVDDALYQAKNNGRNRVETLIASGTH